MNNYVNINEKIRDDNPMYVQCTTSFTIENRIETTHNIVENVNLTKR